MSHLFFSCEIGQREAIPRIWFAILAATKFGLSTVIGHKFTVSNLLKYKEGFGINDFFLHKDANDDSIKYFKNAKDRGLKTIALDEEFLNHAEIQVPQHLASATAQGYVDAFFASSSVTESIARSLNYKTFDTGNLRIGLASYLRGKKNNINRQKKLDVLINSPTGTLFTISPFIRHLEISSRLARSGMISTFDYLSKGITFEIAVTNQIIRLLRQLKEEGKAVMIRPHPAESRFFWSRVSEEIGCEVDDYTFNSILRIFDASSVAAFDCTTLLESLFMEVPFINLSSEHYGGSHTFANRYLNGRFTHTSDFETAKRLVGRFIYW